MIKRFGGVGACGKNVEKQFPSLTLLRRNRLQPSV
jgi:hypothetical protein